MRLLIYLFFVALLPISCNVEREISFDDIHEPQLAVTAILNIQDTLHRVFITSTISSIAIPEYDTIRDATVILEGGDMTYEFNYNEASGYYEHPFSLPFEAGQVWWLNVLAPDLGSVQVSQTVPSFPTDIVVDTSRLERIDNFSELDYETQVELPLSFTDVADRDNYYIIKIVGTGATSYFRNGEIVNIDAQSDLFVDANTPIVEHNTPSSLYARDQDIDGQKIDIDLSFSSFLDTLKAIEVQLISTTREYYLYSSSTALFNNAGPFTEPVSLYSNVENGAGVFALQQVYALKIEN